MGVPRRPTWALVETSDGSFLVLLHGREVQYDLTRARAEAYVRTRFSANDRVVLVEKDGYSSEITRQFLRRSGWRSGRAKSQVAT